MAIKRLVPKAQAELIKADEPEEKNSHFSLEKNEHAQVAESIKSILALLRGLAPTLIGSAPNAVEIQKLLENLRDPR